MNSIRKDAAMATRQNIIEAAFKIVGESGYDALTTGLLIKEAGIAKGTLYHHFASLDDVICAMIVELSNRVISEVPIENYVSMEKYLEDLGLFCIDKIACNPAMMNLFYGFIPKGFNQPKFQQLVADIFVQIAEKVTPALYKFYQGKVDETKIDAAIRMVDIFSIGFCVHQCVFQDRQKYLALWQDFSHMLIRFVDSDLPR